MNNMEYIKFVEENKADVSDAIKPILSVGEFFFEAGQASRQAEIDALSALGEMSEQNIDDLVKRNIELQKLVEALSSYVGSDDFIDVRAEYPFQSNKLSEILKGNNHD